MTEQESIDEFAGKLSGMSSRFSTNIISLGQMTENGSEVNMVGDVIKVYDNGKLLMLVKRTSNRLYKISLELAKPICLLTNFEKPEGVAGARNSADGAACSPPAAGEASPSTSTLRIEVPGSLDTSNEAQRLDKQKSKKVRNLFRLRKISMGEEADCIHARTADRDATRKEVLETFMKVGKEREALLTNLQTKMKSFEEKFGKTQKEKRSSHWHYVRSSLWQPLQQHAEIFRLRKEPCQD
ncbi:hypothetical protein AKJ16_DCAP05427 [Drosera capensis]